MSGILSTADKTDGAQSPAAAQALTPYERLKTGVWNAGVSVIAASIAYLLTRAVGIDGLWACITAIAVTQTTYSDTVKLGQRQFVGSVIGGAVSLVLVVLLGNPPWVEAIAVFLAISACYLFKKHESGPLAGITATIVVLGQTTGSPEQTAIFRLSEVALGAVSGVAVVWVQRRFSKEEDRPA